jgi:DNA-binding MarR family transcriptional regulator
MTRDQERPSVTRAFDAFEGFQQRLMTVHAPEFAAMDLTMAQAKLLYVITAGGPLTMSEVAHRLHVTVSTASSAVDHLVAVRFLSRTEDPTNRRQVQVAVTDLGRETLAHLRELNNRQLRALFAVMSDEDLAVVERATRIMTTAIGTVLSSDERPADEMPPTTTTRNIR